MVGLKKMSAEISFIMRVVSPFETVWSSSYELFCVGSKKYLTWRVIFDLFCVFHETILEGFWGHLEVENRLEDSMGALFSLELDFPGSTRRILEGFRDLLERFLDIFWYLMSM